MLLVAPPQPGPAHVNRRGRWRRWLWAAVDVVFPPECAACRRPGMRLCADCRSQFRLLGNEAICPRCGYAPMPTDCENCRRHPPPAALRSLRSAAWFEGPLRRALHHLKYQRDILLGDTLAEWLCDLYYREGLAADLIVPVPLSPQRLRERGYNQADLLARPLAEWAGVPYAPGALLRSRHTLSQVGLSADERRQNVAGAFVADRRLVAGRQVVVVDDVCTTGATLAACAEALHAAGAAKVWGLTLARAL
ncbi:MAG: ComF family protein [Anaerolineales bacterium]|nr:ComF family protein [Anaerolineales bacterium]